MNEKTAKLIARVAGVEVERQNKELRRQKKRTIHSAKPLISQMKKIWNEMDAKARARERANMLKFIERYGS